MMRTIGDMIAIDSAFIVFDSNNEQPTFNGMSAESKAQQDTDAINTFYERSDVYEKNENVGSRKLIQSSMLHTSKPDESVLPGYSGSNTKSLHGFISNVMNELIGTGKAAITSKIKSIITGNLQGLSLSRLSDQINAFSQGHLWTSVDAVKKKTTNDKIAQTQHVTSIGNLFKAKSAINNI